MKTEKRPSVSNGNSNQEQQSESTSNLMSAWKSAWNRFWFTPQSATTLGLIRIATGCLAFYSLLVWSLELTTFLGPQGMLPPDFRELTYGSAAWSHFDWCSTSTIWIVHWIGLGIVFLFTIGLFTRATSVLTALLVISYANRATGALFGLDQILGLLCIYLVIGNSGGAFSVDRWWGIRRFRLRKEGKGSGKGSEKGSGTFLFLDGSDARDVWTSIAIRLIQLHLCLIYFFAGLGKLQGETWWNGQAIWFSVASYEYQTMDLTWLANHMWLVALLTTVTVFWEVTYAALIWSRLTRPFVLLIAVLTHVGIGLAMGMITFAIAMLVANFSFVEPATIHRRNSTEL